jgi:TctA family transporter
VISISLITISIATAIALLLTNKIIKHINKLNYKTISVAIIILIISLIILITGLEGLLILITTTSIGILANEFEADKITLAGCLILPVIIYTL